MAVCMSTATSAETDGAQLTATDAWKPGVIGGIAGAIAMGALVSVMNSAVLEVAIPSLYTLAPPPNGLAGWVVHVSHGATLGVVFAAIAVATATDSPGKLIGLGVGWGVVTWIGLAALLMPLWLSAVGSPASPPFPNFAPPSLLWHVVYGGVLGGVYAGTKDLF
jgi:hypothetical protein